MMIKNRKSILLIFSILLLIAILFLIPTKQYVKEETEIRVATGIINPANFEPPALQDSDTDVIINKSAVIVNVIRVIGIIVTVVSLMLIGIKYMTGSLEEKADYKKSMIPYLIGVFIFFALTQLLSIIIDLANSFNT